MKKHKKQISKKQTSGQVKPFDDNKRGMSSQTFNLHLQESKVAFKEQGGFSEFIKTLDDFIVLLEANTQRTPDGGRSIGIYGIDLLNDRFKTLRESLTGAYIANLPQGQVVWRKEEKGKGDIELQRCSFDNAKHRDIFSQLIRTLDGLTQTKTTDENSFTFGQNVSAEAFENLQGAATTLREIAGVGKEETPKAKKEYSAGTTLIKWAGILNTSPNNLRKWREQGKYNFKKIDARHWALPLEELPTEYLEPYRKLIASSKPKANEST